MKKKVIQLLYSGLGGHANVVFSMLSGDTKRRWESSLIFVGIEPLVEYYRQYAIDNQIPFEAVLSEKRRPWRSWASIYNTLKRFTPDAIILHNISILPPVALYSLLHLTPIVVVEHQALNLRRWADKLMSIIALVFAKKTVVLTETYKSAYFPRLTHSRIRQKIVVIQNGIDTSVFTRHESRISGREFRIGMAARFVRSKRIDVLAKAIEILTSRAPDTSWRLTLAGSGDFLDTLKKQVTGNAARGSIEVVGYLDQDELVIWFSHLDLYVHASEGEALSTSLLQAMSMGLPIVASDVSGIRELLRKKNFDLGSLVSENSPEKFSEAIELMYSSEDLRKNLGSRGREYAVRNHSHINMFENYDKILEEVLK